MLRDYQLRAIDALRAAYASGSRAPCLVLPTGGGKTVIIAEILRLLQLRASSALVLVHRDEILQQTERKLRDAGVRYGLVAAGHDPDQSQLVQLASVYTAARRLEQISPPRLIVVDECQHATSATWLRVRERFPDALLLGVTATPCRLDGKGLGSVFDRLVIGPTVAELTSAGYLAPARVLAPSAPDLSGAPRRCGDYSAETLTAFSERPGLTGDAVEHYRRHASGSRAVIFCVNRRHAALTAVAFSDAGIQAAAIDGSMPNQERRQILDGLRGGSLRVVTSCDLISEGFDLPELECAILLRPTASLGLHLQQCGRALRPGKPLAVILDHAGNCLRHGLPTTPREWTLAGVDRRAALPAMHRCQVCFSVWEGSATTCPQCGHQREPTAKERKLAQRAGELAELTSVRASASTERKRAATLDELVALGRQRGYKNPHFWARKVLDGRKRRA